MSSFRTASILLGIAIHLHKIKAVRYDVPILVCGTNGNTFYSIRDLEKARQENPKLMIKHDGPCLTYGSAYRSGSYLKTLDSDFTPCPINYDPVCGSDKNTYGNECSFNARKRRDPKLRLLHRGECKEETYEQYRNTDLHCPVIGDPLCGSDGITYWNTCFYIHKKIIDPSLGVKHKGACKGISLSKPNQNLKGDPDFLACLIIEGPVCGIDKRTYESECVFNYYKKHNPGLSLKHKGPCKENFASGVENTLVDCPLVLSPVCGTDGHTYENECTLNRHKSRVPDLSVKYDGPCKLKEKYGLTGTSGYEEETCPMIFLPVCGTDGKTYQNECFLRLAQKLNPKLSVKYRRLCNKPSVYLGQENQDVGCPLTQAPVCSSDGKTYANKCMFMRYKKYDPNLLISHYGPCTDSKESVHEKEGTTDPRKNRDYKSGFRNRHYRNGDNADSSEQLDNLCSLSVHPVCGTDGTTYRNRCVLMHSRIYKPGLEVKHNGQCYEGDEKSESEHVLNRCTLIGEPVCGTDGKTYGSKCFLNLNKDLNPNLSIKHYGSCQDKFRATLIGKENNRLPYAAEASVGIKSHSNEDIIDIGIRL